jgi:hypothetical protein
MTGKPSPNLGSALPFFLLFSNSPNVDCPSSFLSEFSRKNGAPRLVPERSQQPSLHEPIGQQCHKRQLRNLGDSYGAAQALEVLRGVGLQTKMSSGKDSKTGLADASKYQILGSNFGSLVVWATVQSAAQALEVLWLWAWRTRRQSENPRRHFTGSKDLQKRSETKRCLEMLESPQSSLFLISIR